MHIENFNVLVRPWSRTNDITKDEYGSCLEPICSSILYQGRTNILRMSMFLTSNLFISFSRMPFYGRSETYFWYTISCPLVHRGRPWEGAIEWKFFFFFCAMCHSLIGYQSCRSASSRWEPHVISWLVCVASYAQVSCLYIVEFLRYLLHLQNFLLWHSSSRALSRSLCIHRLLSSRSKYFLFFSSLGFQFSKKCMKFLFLCSVIVQKRL